MTICLVGKHNVFSSALSACVLTDDISVAGGAVLDGKDSTDPFPAFPM